MKTFFIAILFLCGATAAPGQEREYLKLVTTIPLSTVKGRIDHLAFDSAASRLYLTAFSKGAVEVIDVRSGQQVSSIGGISEPQGILYVPETNKLYVASGGDGTCRIFEGKFLSQTAVIDFSHNADNLLYDPERQQVYVGYGDGAIGIIDARSNKHNGDIALEGHPESFRTAPSNTRLFVNVPSANHVAVVDRDQGAVVTRWIFPDAQNNYCMAFDEINRRIFVGCRRPGQLLVFDTDRGEVIARVPIGDDADDLFYDRDTKRIYVSCGAGELDVIQQSNPDTYEVVAVVPTSPGAGTSYFSQEQRRLFVAAPDHDAQIAELLIFEVLP